MYLETLLTFNSLSDLAIYKTRGSSIFLRLKEISFDDTNFKMHRVIRVITKRLEITGNLTNFLQTVNENVVALLMAKQAIVQCRKYSIEHVLSTL